MLKVPKNIANSSVPGMAALAMAELPPGRRGEGRNQHQGGDGAETTLGQRQAAEQRARSRSVPVAGVVPT
jgi:hypothetical protein